MRYKLLGRSGLRVSEICLGTMTFGEEWGWGSTKEESARVFTAFAEAGGNFLDTANRYTEGTSEKYLGQFIATERERFVLATKFTMNERPKDPNGGGNQRKCMMQALEGSLKRLQTEYIDLYWLHAWDFMTPVDEVMRALDDAVRAGKVFYVGISDAPAWIVSQANTMADLKGWSPFVALQIQYSLVERTPERDLLPMAQALDLAVTPWSPLGGGLLTGKYKAAADRPAGARLAQSPWGDRFKTERNLRIAQEVAAVAKEAGCTAAQVALAWMRQQPRGILIPIVGARNVLQLKDNLGCLCVQLSADQLARLDALSKIELGFPHDYLTMGKSYVFGETLPLIDSHRALK